MSCEPTGRFEPSAPVSSFDQGRLIRDLTSLLALPAFWSCSEPAFVLRTMFEALESLLEVELCYGAVVVGVGERLQMLRVNRRLLSDTDEAWAPMTVFADADPGAESTATVEVCGTQYYCIRLPIGYVGETGRIVVGSRHPSFPDLRHVTTLHMTLSLAAAGLETARVIRERDEAQRAKDEFLAMLGHELRNPLAPIVTALHLMALKSGGQRTKEQEIIERQVRHLRTLVDDLLDVSRITRGQIELQMQPVELRDIVERALETVSVLVEQRRHGLDVHVPAGLVVDADPTRLTQVMVNLLSNAAKYTPPGGRIQIVAEGTESWVTIRVVDNGTGLPPSLLPRVFDLFVQGGRSPARPEGGLGIGLALVRRLIQAHGGTVSAHSEGEGMGSEFVVQLPAAVSRPAVSPAGRDDSSRVERHEAGSRILVVDDNHDAAELIAVVLLEAGYTVDVAHTGLEALDLAAKAIPDVVVLDVGLPDLDGYDVAAEMRTRLPDALFRVIALTGYGQPTDRERSAAAGFFAHLVKPVDLVELTALVRRSLEKNRGVLSDDGAVQPYPT